VEIRVIDSLAPMHDARLMSYLKPTGCRVGLPINFNVTVLKGGVRRIMTYFPDSLRSPRPPQ
jgi:GxxExxY protein